MTKISYPSWGNYPPINAAQHYPLSWRDELLPFHSPYSFLAYGQGKSYGDSCLNENNILIPTKALNRFISFDEINGIIECEAGVTLAEILNLVIPLGWFLPVVPGTKFISIGGAIANDVHGKNHHVMGTFGKHVLSFELLRSDLGRITCSATNPQTHTLYSATIGGLGLTGLILSAKIQLRRIQSTMLAVEYISFKNIDEFIKLSLDSEKQYEYTVAWLDCANKGPEEGRGIFMRANHHKERNLIQKNFKNIHFPCYLPKYALNNYLIKLFNQFYYLRNKRKSDIQYRYYDHYFFPLDIILEWNKMYGKKGFFQYQFVVPFRNANGVQEVLKTIINNKQGSFLSVLKTFGHIPSPGLLSFPMPGITLAVDIPNRGKDSQLLLDKLDEIVIKYNGKVYPAKDANMRSEVFKVYYPGWEKMIKYKDPKFSSSFWRRVTEHAN
jgi:FAD/FMN-containing dehydrogenase